MKKIFIAFSAALLLFAACKKGEVGPAGAQGPAGPQGPQGIAGNANIMQYTFGTFNFATSFATYSITTSQDTADRSAWFVYVLGSNSRWYPLPGFGVGGNSQYRVNMGWSAGKMNVYVDKVSGAGEIYSQAKVIRMYANGVLPGGRPTNDAALPDMRDYEAVKKYYDLQ